MEKLFALPAESLSITSQFCYCLAELGGALLNQGAAQRASLLRDLLSSAIERLPAGRDLAAFVAEGDTKLGVLWRNYYCLLLSVAGGTVATTKRLLHPDAPELHPTPSSPTGKAAGRRPSMTLPPPPPGVPLMPPPPILGAGGCRGGPSRREGSQESNKAPENGQPLRYRRPPPTLSGVMLT